MKKGFFKRFWWLFLLLAAVAVGAIVAVVLLAGDGGGDKDGDEDRDSGRDKDRGSSASLVAPEDERETDPEKIFVLTVDDFPGQTVVNLDDDPTTNFMVYQKGVEVLEERETLVSMDEEERVYVFEDPSSDLKNAKKGDVLVIPLAGISRELAILVDGTERDGDTLTIAGGELDLSQLISYADIDMDLNFSAEDLIVDLDSLREGESVEFLAPGVPSDAEAAASGFSPVAARTGSGPRVASPLAFGLPMAGWLLGGGEIQVDVNAPGFQFTVPLNISGSLASDTEGWGVGVDADLHGSVTAGVRNIHIFFRFSAWNLYLRSSAICDVPSALNVGGSLNVHWDIVDRELIPVDVPFIGPLTIKLTPVVKVTLEGELEGELNIARTDRLGYDLQLCLNDTYATNLSQSSVEDARMEVELSGALEAMIGVKAGIGIFGAGDLYAQLLAGVRAEGRMADCSYQDPSIDSPETIHTCGACIDGDLYAIMNGSVGVEFPLLKGLLKAGREIEFDIVKLRLPGEMGDFYFSLGSGESGQEKHWGMGTCPNIRYKETLWLLFSDRDPADGAWAEWYNEKEDHTYYSSPTGEDGLAYIYLPLGENTLTAKCPFHETDSTVTVEEENTRAEIVFDPVQPRIFVIVQVEEPVYDEQTGFSLIQSNSLEHFPVIDAAIRGACPDPVFIPFDQWVANYDLFYGVRPGDLLLNVTIKRNWAVTTRVEYHGNGTSDLDLTEHVEYLPFYDFGLSLSVVEEDITTRWIDYFGMTLFTYGYTYDRQNRETVPHFTEPPYLSVVEFLGGVKLDEHHRVISELTDNSHTATIELPYRTPAELVAASDTVWSQWGLFYADPLLAKASELLEGEDIA